jgi:site-specific DNA-methyltransferase (adenine-specific)
MNPLRCGDSLELLPELDKNSIDACISDFPYGLSFMDKKWDSFGSDPQKYQEWCRLVGIEIIRVLKPGAYLLTTSGTRTYHRLTCGLEDAGFEIRDCLGWCYASGFPKSHDISKGFDKGKERKVIGKKNPMLDNSIRKHGKDQTQMLAGKEYGGLIDITEPVTPLAKQWQGWGTGLKPAWEPIVIARKSFIGTVCENVERYGVGGVNIDACRIPLLEERETRKKWKESSGQEIYRNKGQFDFYQEEKKPSNRKTTLTEYYEKGGRWPSNLIRTEPFGDDYDRFFVIPEHFPFIVVPKPSPSEKNKGCEELEKKPVECLQGNLDGTFNTNKVPSRQQNFHPTCKPINLMMHLIKLVTIEGATVLDPFLGSGTTAIACELLGRNYIGIEKNPDYMVIAKKRVKAWKRKDGNVLKWL